MNAIIIFIKNPELGKVKTRLAETLGNQKALDIYNSLLDYTRTVASLFNAKRFLFYSSEIHNDNWSTDLFDKKLQSGDNLGERMYNAFEEVLKANSKAVIVGSDCPKLSPMILSDAFKALDDNDVVIGPSLDGGYYLLGMNSLHATLFQDINWSTDQVLPRTLDKINADGLKYKLLTALSDVDYEEDWLQYGWQLD